MVDVGIGSNSSLERPKAIQSASPKSVTKSNHHQSEGNYDVQEHQSTS